MPKPEEPVLQNEKIEEAVEDWDSLYLERGKLKKEFKETYGNLQATLEELNAIHAKWLHYQDKRIHRLHTLGRDEYIATTLETISEDYQNWLDILSVYAIIHNTTITISCSDIEDVKCQTLCSQVLPVLMIKWIGLQKRLLQSLLFYKDMPETVKIK